MSMTMQEIFDRVATHLIKQKGPATNEDGECLYRGEGGTMCAAGCLIADEHYRPIFEGRAVHEAEVLGALVASGVIAANEGPNTDVMFLLCGLQGDHDDVANETTDYPEAWDAVIRLSLLRTGAEFNLDTKVLEGL